MSKSESNTQNGIATNRNGPRPKYVLLGTDGTGASHVYRTTDDAILVVADGALTLNERLDSRHDVDDWVAHVETARGWADRQYGVSLVDALAASLEAM